MTRYLAQTRTLAFGLFAIAPLLLTYEYYIPFFRQYQFLEIRNASEIYIKKALAVVGLQTPLQLGLLYAGIAILVFVLMRRRGESLPRPAFWGVFLLETIAYAVAFGFLTRFITGFLLSLQSAVPPDGEAGIWPQVLFALAAGVYEELLFRLLLVGSLMVLFRAVLPGRTTVHVVVASLVSASLFSLHHYQSLEMVHWGSFLFRLVAGFILGVLYVLRGLGAAVYTHALYDIFFLFRS